MIYHHRLKMPGTSEPVCQPCGCVGVEPTSPEVTELFATAKSKTARAGNGRSQYVSALPLSYTHHRLGAWQESNLRPLASMRSNCGLHHCQTGAGEPAESGASRSARTFVSSSSGKRLRYLSYRGELVRPARLELACLEHSLLRAACLPIPPRAYGADPRTCTEKQPGLSRP